MKIPVLVEPAFQRSLWCKLTLNGLYAETRQKKYTLSFLNSAAYAALDYDALWAGEPRLAVVVGTSPSWMQQALAVLEAHGIHSILVNYEPVNPSMGYSRVHMDYISAMQRLISYFHDHQRHRTALLGVNPNSSADRIKTRYFAAVRGSNAQAHIYENPQNISQAIDRFVARVHAYDSVICANDLVAVSLFKALKRTSVRVPEDLFVVGFGESILAQRCQPSLTTAALNHEEMGRQAVRLFAYLARQEDPLSASIRMESALIIRQSTANLPEGPLLPPRAVSEEGPTVDFYNDAEIEHLLAMERFHAGLDETDARVLALLAEGCSQEAIAEICQVSASTVGYRIRTMMAQAGVATRQELVQQMVHSLHFQ